MRAAHEVNDFVEPADLRRRLKLRYAIALDGRLEFESLDSRGMHVVALNPVGRLLACDAISKVKTLISRDDYIDGLLAQDDRRASMAKHVTALEMKGRGREAHPPANRSKLSAQRSFLAKESTRGRGHVAKGGWAMVPNAHCTALAPSESLVDRRPEPQVLKRHRK